MRSKTRTSTSTDSRTPMQINETSSRLQLSTIHRVRIWREVGISKKLKCSYQIASSLGRASYPVHSHNGLFWYFSDTPFRVFFYFLFCHTMIHTPDHPHNPQYQSALHTRNRLRVLQASRMNDTHRIDKTLREIILGVTWLVAERLSGERLPR
jgi:hypothetical protein